MTTPLHQSRDFHEGAYLALRDLGRDLSASLYRLYCHRADARLEGRTEEAARIDVRIQERTRLLEEVVSHSSLRARDLIDTSMPPPLAVNIGGQVVLSDELAEVPEAEVPSAAPETREEAADAA